MFFGEEKAIFPAGSKMSHLFWNANSPKTDLVFLTRQGYQGCISPANERRVNICLFVLCGTRSHTNGHARFSMEVVSHGWVGCYLWVIVQGSVASRQKNEISDNKERERGRERVKSFPFIPPLRRAPHRQWGRTLLSHIRNLKSSCVVCRRLQSVSLLQELITTSFPKSLFPWMF